METQYTGKDHMAAVFGNGQTDRMPVRAMQSFGPVLKAAGLTGKEVLTESDKYVQALAKVIELSPSDAATILVGDPALFGEYVNLSFQEIRALGPKKRVLDDKSTLSGLKVCSADGYERLAYFLDICKKAVEAMPDVLIDVFGLSPWSTAMNMRGIETMIFDTNDDPDFVHALLRFTTDLSKVIGDAILETGVGMITIGDPSAGCSVISPVMFRKWAKPYLRETIQHLKRENRAPVFLHICGYTDPILEDLVELGVDGLSIDAPASLKKLVDISGSKIVIEGNFPGELYMQGTREEIEEKVKESIDIAGKANGYRYILCSGCQVPDTAPQENVTHYLNAGKLYGRRPLA